MIDTGGRIKSLRLERGLTLEELSDQLNEQYGTSLNKGNISKWENNIIEPQLSNMRILALFFDVSLDYLLHLNNDRRPIILKNFPERFKDPEQAKMFLNLTTVFTQDSYQTDSLSDDDAVSFANEIINQVRTIAQKYLR